MSSHAEDRARSGTGTGRTLDVLVVSESPELIAEAQSTLRPLGIRVMGCLGPAHGPCFLDTRGSCPLAAHATVTLVDSPAAGTFTHHWKAIRAGDYAERLARAHPDCFVLMCGDAEWAAGPSGEVTHATSARSALVLLRELGTVQSRHATEQEGREAER